MYCKNCGQKMQNDANFCRGCGTPSEAPAAPRVHASNVAVLRLRPVFIPWAMWMSILPIQIFMTIWGGGFFGGFSMFAALLTEVVMTMMFLVIVLGATDERAPKGLAPVAIGLGLTLIHLISIPVTNTSVNPARSTGVAVYVGDWAVSQLWLFWTAPIVGAVIGAVVYRYLGSKVD